MEYILAFVLGWWYFSKKDREAKNAAPHEHPGAGWHVHPYDGKRHIHPQGMNGPWVEVSKDYEPRPQRRPSDDLYLPPRFREEH